MADFVSFPPLKGPERHRELARRIARRDQPGPRLPGQAGGQASAVTVAELYAAANPDTWPRRAELLAFIQDVCDDVHVPRARRGHACVVLARDAAEAGDLPPMRAELLAFIRRVRDDVHAPRAPRRRARALLVRDAADPSEA